MMTVTYHILATDDLDWALEGIISLTCAAAEAGTAPHLVIQDREFYTRFFSGEGHVVAAFHQGQMIGFSLLGLTPFLSSLWKPYLKRRGLSSAGGGVLIQSLISPEFRGQGIGRKMTEMRIDMAKRLGIRQLFVTVSPHNTPSCALLKSYGFKVLERRVVYAERVERFLMECPLIEQEAVADA